jgi:hypothetical protein
MNWRISFCPCREKVCPSIAPLPSVNTISFLINIAIYNWSLSPWHEEISEAQKN